MKKSYILSSFYELSDYLESVGKINSSILYKNEFSSFLSHAFHIHPYFYILHCCRNEKVLDIGCFIGYGEEIIYKYANEIVAIDTDDNALEYARSKNIPKVKFKKVNANKLPFENDSFNIIIAFQLIEHLPPENINDFLFDIKRVLMPGGMVYLSTPNRKFRLLPFQKPFNLEHYQEFSASQLHNILSKVFKEVNIYGLHADKWMENIERQRVRRTFRYYFKRLIYSIFPSTFRSIIKKYIMKYSNVKKNEDDILITKQIFNESFQMFDENNIVFKEHDIENSIDLFAICK